MGIMEILHELDKGVDAEADSWFLMGGPIPIFSVIAVYLIFVLKVGPMCMKNIQPFVLKKVLFAYNAFQICFNIFILINCLKINRIMETFVDSDCGFKRNRLQLLSFCRASWYYYMCKIIDLLDTVFFVLRKKNNQITFLHTYHHAIMVFYAWVFLKYYPGEELLFAGTLNTTVHILMYTYYLVAAMGPQYQKYLWWKEHMTKIQIIQFILVILYILIINLKGCPLPKFISVFAVVNALFFLYLFIDFYRKAYQAKNKNSKVKN